MLGCCLDTCIIVHFKRLGNRSFYDLFERCYLFFLNRYAYSKTKPQDIWGYFFRNFLRRYVLSFLMVLYNGKSMVLYNGKSTETMTLLCGDPDSVDGETSGFGTAIYQD